MTSIVQPSPRLSRAKALIGALLATMAIAGTMQVANPDSASAVKLRGDGCTNVVNVRNALQKNAALFGFFDAVYNAGCNNGPPLAR